MFCRCGVRLSNGRIAVGADTCLRCGDNDAARETAFKRTQIGPAYNKGAVQYLGGPNYKQTLLDAGRKTSADALTPVVQDEYTNPASEPVRPVRTEPKPKPRKAKRRAIGVYYIGQECYTWWEGDNPSAKGASRWARLRQ